MSKTSDIKNGYTKPDISDDVKGALVLCNHWTQFGIGETFPQGPIGSHWYKQNYSTAYQFEMGWRWLNEDPGNRICHELDAYFLEALAREDPDFINTIRKTVESGRMELVGATYGQPQSQVFGYESAIRQLTMGQETVKRYLGYYVSTYAVEEQSFFSQLPQLLKQAGYQYAAILSTNSGRIEPLPHDLVFWEGPDGSSILTVPNHEEYGDWSKGPECHAPLKFRWIEGWVPGIAEGPFEPSDPYGYKSLEVAGWRQMTLTEYIQWARKRTGSIPNLRMPMDKSNYENNWFGGGWGYENERITRGSNQCESLLMVAELLCAGGAMGKNGNRLRQKLRNLWSRLLIAQNHDPYIAGTMPAYIDGIRTFNSELSTRQFALIRDVLVNQFQLGTPLKKCDGQITLLNPCPWPVSTPLFLEIDCLVWPAENFMLTDQNGSTQNLNAMFRSDSGNILLGPVMLELPAYGTMNLALRRSENSHQEISAGKILLTEQDNGHKWRVELPEFIDIIFEPLLGEWHQVPLFGEGPRLDGVIKHRKLEDTPVTDLKRASLASMEVVSWRNDCFRIPNQPEPVLSIESMAFAGNGKAAFIEFHHRLFGNIRFGTGALPGGTWRFRLRVPTAGLRIFADSPYCEEERRVQNFYCSRYIRLEWSGRHLLWCPSQNTRFQRIDQGETVFLECTIFNFVYNAMSPANWGMRFYAGKYFSPAESIRLSETFHRQPLSIPSGYSAGVLKDLTTDNPHVVISHVFPSGAGSISIRVINASDKPQGAMFSWLHQPQKVSVADLDGKPIQQDGQKKLVRSERGWQYEFRPWEITTFCIERPCK